MAFFNEKSITAITKNVTCSQVRLFQFPVRLSVGFQLEAKKARNDIYPNNMSKLLSSLLHFEYFTSTNKVKATKQRKRNGILNSTISSVFLLRSGFAPPQRMIQILTGFDQPSYFTLFTARQQNAPCSKFFPQGIQTSFQRYMFVLKTS